MKRISMFLIVMMVFMVGFTRLSAGTGEVVLDASQVTSAADIEYAINIATSSGTQPGTVTLDSSQGDFIFSGDDHTVDIQVSNITLRSENGAVIRNCENGVFLDTSTTRGITVEGITFYCQLSGVLAWGGHEDVTIKDNTFHVFANGIYVHEGRDWTITGNHVEAAPTSPYPDIGGIGVYLYHSSDVEIDRNEFFVGSGVILNQSTNSKVTRNQISAVWHGVVLGSSASNNLIRANDILSTRDTGILFWGGNEKNKVFHNTVQCTWSYDCTVVYADLTYTPLSPTNKIIGNKLITPEGSSTFTTKLLPGFSSDFKLGPAGDGTVHVVDVTPLDPSWGGAHTPFMIVPYYDGEQWVDMLRVTVPLDAPSEDVQITVYDLGGLHRTMAPVTDSLYPGERRSYPISLSTENFPAVYFADLDPLAASVEGRFISDFLIRPEFMDGQWKDALFVQMPQTFEPDPLAIHMEVLAAEFIPLVVDFNVYMTRNDTWPGFILGPSSLDRAYVIRVFPVNADVQSELAYYRIQPEYNGEQWNDVLRLRMGNLEGDWQSATYNIKVYACDAASCP